MLDMERKDKKYSRRGLYKIRDILGM